MKKMILTLAVSVMTLVASAQTYVGGGIGLWRNSDEKTTSFNIQPEIGFNLNSKWALGVALGYEHASVNGTKANAFSVSPYARYTFARLGAVSLFADGTAGVTTAKVKGSDSATAWEIGIKPGVAVSLNNRISFVAHVGFLGYKDTDEIPSMASQDGFGFNLNGNSLTFGLYYNF